MSTRTCPQCDRVCDGCDDPECGDRPCPTCREQFRAPGAAEQPSPAQSTGPAVWALVLEDMRARDAAGAAKYGTRLQTGNGLDFLLDAYQEALDLAVYLRGAIYERDGR